MEAAPIPELSGESGHLLRALRHALADPLSAITLKLNLVERRLQTPAGADSKWVAERMRAAQADVSAANRLLDLLLRLAEIAGEPAGETSIHDVCRAAGLSLEESASAVPRVSLRLRSSVEAIKSFTSFATRGGGSGSPVARAGLENGRVSLFIEGTRATPDARPDRLLDLPHGVDGADDLFMARAAVEADGGRLELTGEDGRLAAHFSWPVGGEGFAGRKDAP